MMLRIRIAVVLVAIVSAVGFFALAEEAPKPKDAPKRLPWTTSKITGSPEAAPPFKSVNPFPKLKFNHPLLLVNMPGTNRLCVGEQDGKLWSFENSPDATAELLIDFKKEVQDFKPTPGADEVESVYGFVFHPDFVKNRQCFVCYTLKSKKSPNLDNGTRVSRFHLPDAKPYRIDFKSEELLFTYLQGGHNGGDLHFGNEGYLYISTGDGEVPSPPDPRKTGQDVSDLLASILRIDVNRKDAGLNYAIPKDNPFVGQSHNGKPIRGEIWAYGFRNPWRMSFDRATNDLWVGDVGWESWEMIHKVEKGGNSGWSIVEASKSVYSDVKIGPTPIRPPAIELSHAVAGSITGGYVYHGKKHPELAGKYIFGDWMTRRIWAATVKNGEVTAYDDIVAASIRIVAFGEDNAGEIYAVDYDAGTIFTFEKNPVAAQDRTKFPRTISQSGLLSSVKANTPATGVYPFEIIAHQWQDYTTSEYLVGLPGTSVVTDFANKKTPPGDVTWRPYHIHLPKDGVLAKTISIEMERGNPATNKRLETQILHFDGDNWQAYTYAWRDDQTDADLVPADGSEKSFTVKDNSYPGGTRDQTWTYASRVQCMQCHSTWSEYALGFNREQLNRPVQTVAGTKNQLSWLGEFGLMDRVGNDNKPVAVYTEAELKKLKRHTNPHDEKAPVNDRAKAYLHANCGHCHRLGGGGGVVEFELHAEGDLLNKKLIDAIPVRGTFDLPDAKIVAPGDADRSTLYYRMAKFGTGRMPHMGAELPDEAGLSLVRKWIAGLPHTTEPADTLRNERTAAGYAKSLANPIHALALARNIGEKQLTKGEVKDLMPVVATLPPGHVRDLFEGYLPSNGKPKTLGANPRPRAILALKGDAANGQVLFAATKSQCMTCHKIEGKGIEIGADLSQIGKTRTRENLLESILEPSRRIELPYQSYLVRTLSGQAFTGLLVKRDAKAIVLKDALNKLITVAADDLESIDASRISLMPAGLLRDFTAQEAADLLEYLSQRK